MSINQIKKYPKIKCFAVKSKIFIDKFGGNIFFPFYAILFLLNFRFVKTCCADGIKFRLWVTNYISHYRWHLFATKESEVRKFIGKNLSSDDVFVDIGANLGVFSLYAVAKCRPKQVISIEPMVGNYLYLNQNIRLNGWENRVQSVCVAMSDFSGFASFNIQDESTGAAANSLGQGDELYTDEGFQVKTRLVVPTSTLDNVCEYFEVVPKLIKIDTDGHELEILRGAERLLSNSMLRFLAIEVQDANYSKVSALLASFNFKPLKDESVGANHFWAREESLAP